jgi:hypothetical protein
MTAQAITERLEQAQQVVVTAPAANPVMDMIRQAVAAGQPLDVIRELKDMAKELAADEARRAFDAALSDAKSEMPVILKNRSVGYDHKDGNGKTSYRHEDLGEIARTVDPILSKYGLSYRFRTTSEPNQPVVVTCIVAHRAGHSEENTLSAGRDESGKKNSIQAIASTITYLQRYTLKAALGLAVSDDDDAARADEAAVDTITEDQRSELQRLLEDAGATADQFCAIAKIEALSDLPSGRFDGARTWIANRKTALEKQKAADPKTSLDQQFGGDDA